MKRQATEWEKIFANDVTNKGLVCKINKQLMQLNIIKTKQPNQKMVRGPKQTFLQERHTDGQEACEKIFNIANYQTTASQNYNEISPHTSQNSYQKSTTSAGKGVGEGTPSYSVGRNLNWHSHYEGQCESESLSVVSDSLRPHGVYSPWSSPGQNSGVGILALLQGIFPTQGSNPGGGSLKN